MSVDVLGTLTNFENPAKTAINITPAIASAFGASIGTAISNLFSGSMQVNGATYSLKGTSVTATVSGTGSAAPLVQQFQVALTFTASGDAAQLVFAGTITGNILLSDAWPAALNEFPFNQLALTKGTAGLTVNPGDESFSLSVSATPSFEGTVLGTGLLDVNYANSKLGFLAGFIIEANGWTPFAHWPVLKSLTLSVEAGVFFSTITVTQEGLKSFQSLNLPYLPDEVDPGLTFIASIALTGSLAPIASILPSGTRLNLLANLPSGETAQGSVTAGLTETTQNNSFQLKTLDLVWQSTSADSGTISIKIDAGFNEGTQSLDMTGTVKFVYGTTPSLEGSITVALAGAWSHPFGIKNLAIDSFSLGFSLAEDGITLALGGIITIGTGPHAANLELAGGITDFEVPTFVLAELSEAYQGPPITLAELISDFIGLNLDNLPLLNQIAFKDLEFYAVAEDVTIDNKQYYPGIGLTGDVIFFGYELDFAFSLTTTPSVAVKAKGSITSQNKGPINITVAGVNILTLSDSTGTTGPSACIDTTGSGFCGGTAEDGYYFYINAKVVLLGLVSESIVAKASKSLFELDLALAASTIFSDKLHVEFVPASNDFAASISTQFNPPDITLGPWGAIPQFTIPTPKISFCGALGTIMPTAAPCSDNWMPSGAPYVRFDLQFTWGPIDFSFDLELDFNSVSGAFSNNNFGSWLLDLVLKNPIKILDAILQSAEQLAKLLIWIGKELLEFAEYVFDKVVQIVQDVFKYAYEAAAQIVSDAVSFIEKCAADVSNDAMNTGTGATLSQTPVFLADLAGSPKGQQFLYHYYVQRPELEKTIKSNTAAGARCREILASHRSSSASGEGNPVPLILDLIQASAPVGDEQLSASVNEMSAELGKYRDLSYPEFLAALKA